MSVISHACIVYRDNTKRFFTVRCNDIRLKRNSKCSITPKTKTDFDKKYVYYAKWQNCDERCNEDCDEHVGYYPAFILLLGESEAEIEKQKDGQRLSVPIVKDSSESEEFQPPVPKKFKHSNSIKDAQSQTNLDILSKYNSTLMLASRTRLDQLDCVDDAGNITNQSKGVENENEENDNDRSVKQQHETQIEISEDQQIQELQAKLKELQEARDQSNQSLRATGNTKDIDAVKRNLFREDVDKTKKTSRLDSGIQSQTHSGGSSTVKSVKTSRLTIRSIEKINTSSDLNLKINSARSNPTPSQQTAKRRELRGEDDPVATSSKGSSSMEPTSKVDYEKSVESPVQELLNSTDGKRKPIENDHETLEDDEDAEDDSHVLCRLEPKMKHRKSAGDANNRVNKKVVKEIEAALQHYKLGIDGSGRRLYEVTDKRIYLGEGLNMSETAWHLIYHKKATIFLNDMILVLWGERKLMNRCQNKTKVTTKLADRSPMKELTPVKKRLLYKLYHDHLDEKNVSVSDRMKLLKKVPETLTTKINNIRKKYYT